MVKAGGSCQKEIEERGGGYEIKTQTTGEVSNRRNGLILGGMSKCRL